MRLLEKCVNSRFWCVCQWNKRERQRPPRTADCERFSRQPKRLRSYHAIQSMFHFARWPFQHFGIHVRLAKTATPTNRTDDSDNSVDIKGLFHYQIRITIFLARKTQTEFLFTYTCTDGAVVVCLLILTRLRHVQLDAIQFWDLYQTFDRILQHCLSCKPKGQWPSL